MNRTKVFCLIILLMTTFIYSQEIPSIKLERADAKDFPLVYFYYTSHTESGEYAGTAFIDETCRTIGHWICRQKKVKIRVQNRSLIFRHMEDD